MDSFAPAAIIGLFSFAVGVILGVVLDCIMVGAGLFEGILFATTAKDFFVSFAVSALSPSIGLAFLARAAKKREGGTH